jgi:hypothetical protein
MKDVPSGSVLLAPFHLLSHGRPQQVTTVWVNPDPPASQRATSVFVLAIATDPVVRRTVEADLATVAISRMLKATRSFDIYPEGPWGADSPTKEELWSKIQALGCDAIFTVCPLNMKGQQRYVPGAIPGAPHPRHSCDGAFGTYLERTGREVSAPGYYDPEKRYFLEGNVYDTATGAIQWSMQSIGFDPVDLDTFSKEYALLLIDQLKRS